jgi:hypothetical protein
LNKQEGSLSDIRNRGASRFRWRHPWKLSSFGALSLLFLSGCAEIQAPTAKEALMHPFGTQPPFPRGTSQQQVLASWGEPDHRILRGRDELGNPKEEWIYAGRLPNLPVDYQYVSRTKHLFFEGDNLVRWETEEARQSAE